MIEARKGEKHCHMPKLRVEQERRDAYLKAFRRERRKCPKMSMADWMRLALDMAAEG